MGLKKDYQETEIGIIPENWEVRKLRDCLLETPSYGVNAPATDYDDKLPTYLRITDITDDGRFSTDKKASVRYVGIEKYFLNSGELVFARTGASVGKSYLYKPEDGVLAFAGFLIRVKPNPTELYPEYLSSYVQTERYWNWVRVMSMRSGQPGINGNEYGQLPIPLPPLPEQQAIAAALSDVDALLTSLDALIAKKRLVKQGAMQELLTGKRRLPGFSGEWEELNIAEHSTLKARIGWQGLTTKEYMTTGEYRLITGTDFIDGEVAWDTCHFVEKERYDQDKYIQVQIGDVLITKDGTIGKVAYVDQLPSPATLNSGVFVVRPINNKYHPRFLYCVLCSRIFDDFLRQLQAGSTINHLYQKDFISFKFLAPSYTEQTAIAEILSDMDAEIAALEGRREKTRLLKQGMMQELLTGRIRLI